MHHQPRFSNPEHNRNLDALTGELKEVRSIMTQNITELFDRGKQTHHTGRALESTPYLGQSRAPPHPGSTAVSKRALTRAEP